MVETNACGWRFRLWTIKCTINSLQHYSWIFFVVVWEKRIYVYFFFFCDVLAFPSKKQRRWKRFASEDVRKTFICQSGCKCAWNDRIGSSNTSSVVCNEWQFRQFAIRIHTRGSSVTIMRVWVCWHATSKHMSRSLDGHYNFREQKKRCAIFQCICAPIRVTWEWR